MTDSASHPDVKSSSDQSAEQLPSQLSEPIAAAAEPADPQDTSVRNRENDCLNRASATSQKRRWTMRLMAIALGLLTGLLVAEATVRLLGIQPTILRSRVQLTDLLADPPVYYHCYPHNRHGELQGLPDVTRGEWKLQDCTFERRTLPLEQLSETPWCVEYQHSSMGIRDREFSADPPSGVTRMAIVGDSFVFGEGVPENLTLPRQIQSLLGDQFECVNGGQSGANSEQVLRNLEQIVPGSKSTRAVLVFIPNDISMTQALAKKQDYINDLILVRDQYLQHQRRRSWLHGRLRILDLLLSRQDLGIIRNNTIRWYLDCYDEQHNAENLKRLAEGFRKITTQPDCRVALVIYPLLENFESSYPLISIHQTVARMARDAHLDVLDLAPAFAGANTESLWVHETDHHPNGRANKIAAEAIVTWLREDCPGFLAAKTRSRK